MYPVSVFLPPPPPAPVRTVHVVPDAVLRAIEAAMRELGVPC